MQSKMFRTIANKLAGRKKVIDESMKYSVVRELLAELNKTTRIKVIHSPHTYEHILFEGTFPSEVAEFVEKEFEPPNDLFYFKANHQIFIGKQDERHYIDLQRGVIKANIGRVEIWEKEGNKATLEYVLKRK